MRLGCPSNDLVTRLCPAYRLITFHLLSMITCAYEHSYHDTLGVHASNTRSAHKHRGAQKYVNNRWLLRELCVNE